jgi:hypothetical protein
MKLKPHPDASALPPPVLVLLLFILAATVSAQTNSEFSVQINDGLGQPVSGVAVDVFLTQKTTDGQERKVELGRAVSDTNGLARGLYDKTVIPTNESFSVALSKSGYAGYVSGPKVNYLLRRQFNAADLARILQLPTDGQRRELRELLAGVMDPAGPPLDELIFAQENRARLTLRWLLDDLQVGPQAGELLAFIGRPEDLGLLIKYAPEPNGEPAVNRWSYAVASALLNPATDREWLFLKRCACDNFGDHWVDLAGIRTLRLIASPRSLQILQDVRKLNPARTNEVDAAVAYISTQPAPLTGKDAATAAERLAQALNVGTWMGNEPPRFDDLHDAALVDCNFLAGGSQFLVFTATLRQDGPVWRVNGVRQTRQKILPKGPSKPSQARN